MKLKLNLRKLLVNGRKGYAIESIEKDDRKVNDVLIRSPDGDIHLTVGHIDFARNYPRIYQSLLQSTNEWVGTDSITIDKLPS